MPILPEYRGAIAPSVAGSHCPGERPFMHPPGNELCSRLPKNRPRKMRIHGPLSAVHPVPFRNRYLAYLLGKPNGSAIENVTSRVFTWPIKSLPVSLNKTVLPVIRITYPFSSGSFSRRKNARFAALTTTAI